MRFDIITIFPEAFSYLKTSMLKRAKARRLIDVRIHNLRDFAKDKHKSVDDKPYGGGPGMVFKLEPLIRAFSSVVQKTRSRRKYNSHNDNTLTIIFSASGKQFDQRMAREWEKKYKRIVMVAGHYEGIDERIKKLIKDLGFKIQEISIGPYVLTGGELPAMAVIDAVTRHIPGVLGKEESLEGKRYGVGVPVYTRPEVFRWKGKTYRVPKTLLSGNHARIEEWRRRNKKSVATIHPRARKPRA